LKAIFRFVRNVPDEAAQQVAWLVVEVEPVWWLLPCNGWWLFSG
jgi:hypothetical protein